MSNVQILTVGLVFAYLLIVGLVFAVVFSYIYILEINAPEESTEEKLTLLALESLNMETYLRNGVSNAPLITFYDEPAENPYINIAYTYETEPATLSFKITDPNGNTVSGESSLLLQHQDFYEVRYPFTPNGSEYYVIRYTLDNAVTNIENVSIVRVELKTP